ncbi:hypothetical protein GMDG_01803 [Pseudogymnoascus destructans 20631-21]|uniref:Uncharacterized protein n=1 Tax=Pseudogymnoascus destructans (strain ATCC MYA-4855 / 20631-21) TaxID=658429 RepID=L8FYS3_PSED2|nr:hypothetical protein GMDG_01803 [Pseudogymnoascus destructans 20631-21]
METDGFSNLAGRRWCTGREGRVSAITTPGIFTMDMEVSCPAPHKPQQARVLSKGGLHERAVGNVRSIIRSNACMHRCISLHVIIISLVLSLLALALALALTHSFLSLITSHHRQ